MIFQVNVAREAEKILDRLDRPTLHRIRQRILFSVDRSIKVIYILTVDTRGQVYRHS